jgi:hypothetical protein
MKIEYEKQMRKAYRHSFDGIIYYTLDDIGDVNIGDVVDDEGVSHWPPETEQFEEHILFLAQQDNHDRRADAADAQRDRFHEVWYGE